ncbi:MAG: PQQ-binding-like beta-propeller repeat protein [Anaerolineae bacterium]|nr:PQQ-binding-like beta-propeller repeat protein [Anaerolineae bacterium]
MRQVGTMELTIFCPQCRQLILEQPGCSGCGWQRPAGDNAPGAEIWHIKLTEKLIKPYSYPVAGTRCLYICTNEGTLVALDLESGNIAWQRALDNGCVAPSLALHQDRLLVACQDMRAIPTSGKALLALDATTGRDVWQYETAAHSLSGPTVVGDMLYFAATDGHLYALDIVSGKRQWVARHTPWGPAPPAAANGIVCTGGEGGTITAYAAADGTKLWSFSAEGWFATRPCIEGECVYALSWHDYLYALDAHTGQLLWKYKGECGEAPTTPPLAAKGRVFVGGQVHRDIEAGQEKAYAILALSAQDGVEFWGYLSRDLVFAPLALVDSVLLCSSKDGSFYAIDALKGETYWLTEGESRIVTEPQVVGGIIFFGRRDGSVHAVRWKAKPAEKLLAPATYEQQGEFSLAAAAYALEGEFRKAAALYEKQLGACPETALLYERAGLPEHAAQLWEELGAWERARDLYRQVGDKASLARMMETLDEPLEAAQLYETVGQLAKAADLYECEGDWSSAAGLYERLGQIDKAQAMWESHGEWKRLTNSLLAGGKLVEAAGISEQQGWLEDAARLYEKAEHIEQALRLRVALQDWRNTARLADRLGDYAKKAVALARLGDHASAARAYEQAAHHLTGVSPQDEARIAALYERAADHYDRVFDGLRAFACRQKVRQYRRLPEVQVHGETGDIFAEYEWNTLQLRVENTGFGPACDIRIGLRGKFDVKGPRRVRALLPQKTRALELFVRPRKQQVGPKVPLEAVVTYRDAEGNLYKVNQYMAVPVVEKGSFPGQKIPVRVHLRGDLIQPGSKTQGEEVQSAPTGGHQAVDSGVIRALLLAACTAEDLRRILLYTSNESLRPLLYEFGTNDSLANMIDMTVTYCMKRGLVPDLLAEVEKANPRQYARFMFSEDKLGDSAEQDHENLG